MADAARNSAGRSELSRCCWSLFILDRIHGSSFRILPAIPDQGILPEPPHCTKKALAPPAISNAADEPGDARLAETRDEGINSYALRLLTTWGRLMSYLKSIKQGNLEDAWTANSVYHQIKAQMSQFETVFPEVHRFKNSRFHERDSAELSKDRAYWASWIFTQCIYHTIHCTSNHPFLHVARLQGRQQRRSPSFLQHATDQARLHIHWVVHLLRLCEERGFAIYDPFIGHLAAMIATALFFLRFSKDEELATNAAQDFESLQHFVESMMSAHPHLANTVSYPFLSSIARCLPLEARTIDPPNAD